MAIECIAAITHRHCEATGIYVLLLQVLPHKNPLTPA